MSTEKVSQPTTTIGFSGLCRMVIRRAQRPRAGWKVRVRHAARLLAPNARSAMRRAAEIGMCIFGFVILLAFQLLGIGLHKIGVPLPGGVLGLLLFTFALSIHLVPLSWVQQPATFLVRHMTLLFVPMMAALPGISGELRRDGVALLASLLVSLAAVLLITGGLAHFLWGGTEAAALPEAEGSRPC